MIVSVNNSEESQKNITNFINHEENSLLEDHAINWKEKFKRKKISWNIQSEVVNKKLDNFLFFRYYCEKQEENKEGVYKTLRTNKENYILKTRQIVQRKRGGIRRNCQQVYLIEKFIFKYMFLEKPCFEPRKINCLY